MSQQKNKIFFQGQIKNPKNYPKNYPKNMRTTMEQKFQEGTPCSTQNNSRGNLSPKIAPIGPKSVKGNIWALHDFRISSPVPKELDTSFDDFDQCHYNEKKNLEEKKNLGENDFQGKKDFQGENQYKNFEGENQEKYFEGENQQHDFEGKKEPHENSMFRIFSIQPGFQNNSGRNFDKQLTPMMNSESSISEELVNKFFEVKTIKTFGHKKI